MIHVKYYVYLRPIVRVRCKCCCTSKKQTNKLTTCSCVYSEANSLSACQEISRALRKAQVHYSLHKSPPPVPILGQIVPNLLLIYAFMACIRTASVSQELLQICREVNCSLLNGIHREPHIIGNGLRITRVGWSSVLIERRRL